jgi:hypothetical protein
VALGAAILAGELATLGDDIKIVGCSGGISRGLALSIFGASRHRSTRS